MLHVLVRAGLAVQDGVPHVPVYGPEPVMHPHLIIELFFLVGAFSFLTTAGHGPGNWADI